MFPIEDSRLAARRSAASTNDDRIDVAVVGLPRIANFDEFDLYEFDPWARISGVRLRYVREASDFGRPDLVILPGFKVTVADLEFVRQSGFESKIRRHVGPLHNSMSVLSQDQIDHASPFAPPAGFPPTREWTVVVQSTPRVGWSCSDGHMRRNADARRYDPAILSVSSLTNPKYRVLGSSMLIRSLSGTSWTTRTDASVVADSGLLAGASGVRVSGYEIHVGVSVSGGGAFRALGALESIQSNRAVVAIVWG